MTDKLAKEIFLELVKQQDAGVPVAESKRAVAELFGVTVDEVRAIERRGIEGQWAPLG
jgi:chromosomal replication initiation ATPase DnaA